MDTEIKNAVQAAEEDAPYDREAKRLLGNKHILAYILITLIDEFKGMTAKQAEKYIEGDVYINAIPVEPGLTNKEEKFPETGDRVVGLNTENAEINEGIIHFDIVFYVRMRDGVAQIMVNIEMQKDTPSEYKVLNRAIFYVCRLVSSQKERDFTNSNYDDIKRVYSVWICPKMAENSIKYVHLTSEDILGSQQWDGKLDLLNIMLIGLSRDLPGHDDRYELHRLLGTLLSTELKPEEKLEIMSKEYDIPIEQSIRKEVDKMYSLTQDIRNEGIEQGMRQGIEQGKAEIILNMYQKRLSLEEIAELVNKTVDEVKAIIGQKNLLMS